MKPADPNPHQLRYRPPRPLDNHTQAIIAINKLATSSPMPEAPPTISAFFRMTIHICSSFRIQSFFDSAPGMSDRKGALYFLYTSAAVDRFLGVTFRVICK